ncbi:MFS transporter [Pseudonocardia sp. CA-107938]|uniref:MFS transporter n=1 Tax=Pseudonocardia sp. CA-107938 TaxID=3240021 RepID=UPI003D8A8981
MTDLSDRRAGVPQLLLLLGASSMSVLGAVLIAPVLPLMAQHFAAVPGVAVLVPVVLTVPALVIGLTAGFAGAIVDRLGRLRVLQVALVLYAIAGTAPLYLDDLGAIIATRVVVGLCEAAIMTAATTLIGDYWTGEQRNRYLGLQATVSALSAVVFVALGGLLGAGGWRAPFWMYLLSIVLVLPMARVLWNPAPAGGARAERTPVPWAAIAGPCAVTLVGGAVFYALIVQLSYVLDGIGVTSTGVIGAAVAVMSVATAVGGAVFGRLSRAGLRRLLVAEFALSGAGLIVVFLTSSVPVVVAGAVITGFATGLMLPTLLTWAVRDLEYAQRGRGTGIWTGTLFIGEFVSPLVVVAIAGPAGGLQPALAVLGVLSIVFAAVLWWALARQPAAPGAEPTPVPHS